MTYNIYDPTGNITALVEEEADSDISLILAARVEKASKIMKKHPEVEQVGFVRLAAEDAVSEPTGVDAVLEMAGGEFCGNASMCAAVWYVQKCPEEDTFAGKDTFTVTLQVSGTHSPVRVDLTEKTDCFEACVHMPCALGIDETELSYGEILGNLPVVRLDGISHIIIVKVSPFYELLSDREAAGEAVRKWCRELGVEGLGLMFLDEAAGGVESVQKLKAALTPLVYIPGSDTLFWEHSCASGSCATGLYLASRKGASVAISLAQPGGTLVAESDPASMRTLLHGRVKTSR